MLKVVLDTNIILASISPHSPFRLVMDQFELGAYILCLTTDILLEYEEQLAVQFNQEVAELTVGSMLLKHNVQFAEVFFQWQLVYPDMDDNKFVDCAIAANVHYLVTNDRDFNRLKTIPFPELKVINMKQFWDILQSE
ncbi:MAG: putative toxin-antitoxin system toxin component, PIN family [Saprospiraceae bacterium]|nr:putative toxin-antitoxin system toxin component, PIN family [Saprospiraceae bacterium]